MVEGTFPKGSTHPNTKYLPKATISVPTAETIDTLNLGTLDPYGSFINGCWKLWEVYSFGACSPKTKAVPQ